jgi:hypothetical protein
MSMAILKEIRRAVSSLDPGEVEEQAHRRVNIGLVAPDEAGFAELEEFLLPAAKTPPRKRTESSTMIHRVGTTEQTQFDILLATPDADAPEHAIIYRPAEKDTALREILVQNDDLGLALARNFYPFRQPVVDRAIFSVSRENALFAVVTALPDVIPSLAELPWSLGEFASDTAFLTINQIRLAFMIAAASSKPVGYSLQKSEIGSIVAGAFGWRAIARELAGKIPFGCGLIPKGAIAFAGTFVVAMGLERYHRTGSGFSGREGSDVYRIAYERGKSVVEGLLHGLKNRNVA